MKKVKKVGSKFWVTKSDLHFEVAVAFINNGILFCTPTFGSVIDEHFVGCVCLKVFANGNVVHV